MNHLGLNLKITATALLLFLFSCLGQGYQGFSGITAENYESVIAHIACEYEIEIPLEEVTSFVEGYVFFGTSGCGFPVSRPIDYEVKSQSFSWDAVPDAKSYTVGSLGLKTGEQSHQKTNKTKAKVNTLTPQLYLFTFVSNCLYGGRSPAHIIIIDKDVLFPEPKDEPDLYCDCLTPPQPMEPREDCPFFESTSFAWIPPSSDCQFNKYIINITGSDNYFRSVPFVKIRTQAGGEIVNPMATACNNEIYNFETKQLGVPGKFNILFSSVGAHVYKEETEEVSYEVEGFDCGCVDNEVYQVARLTPPGKSKSLSLSPNPVADILNIKLGLPQNIIINQAAHVSLFSLNGELHYTATQKMAAYNSEIIMNTADLTSGIYILEISIAGERFQEKIIKI